MTALTTKEIRAAVEAAGDRARSTDIDQWLFELFDNGLWERWPTDCPHPARRYRRDAQSPTGSGDSTHQDQGASSETRLQLAPVVLRFLQPLRGTRAGGAHA